MAYQAGDTILDNEYNGGIGSEGTSAYASQAAVDAASPAAGALYGVGYGDRGYGQTTYTLIPVTAGSVIRGWQWSDFRNALQVVRDHQTNTTDALLPPANLFDIGDTIQAHESDPPTNDTYDFGTVLAAADSNRFTVHATHASQLSVLGTTSNTRGSVWSTSIDCEATFAFGSEDSARYFFNSGGEIRLDLSHPGGNQQDSDWNALLGTRVGQVRFGYTATSSTGTSGLSSTIGYYDLTDAYQLIINGTNIGGGLYYTANDCLIYAHRVSFAGVNGGNGTGVKVRILLQDQHTNPNFDQVSAGTKVDFRVLKATFLSGIVTPTVTVNNSF